MLIFSVLMGLSRIYVCVHYPTDVIGGAVIGILCGLVTGLVIYPRFERHNKKIPRKWKKVLTELTGGDNIFIVQCGGTGQ